MERQRDGPEVRCGKGNGTRTHSPDVGLQPRLLLIVLDEEGQALRPVVLEAARQVRVHVVLRERSVQVCVKVPRILCTQESRSDTPKHCWRSTVGS